MEQVRAYLDGTNRLDAATRVEGVGRAGLVAYEGRGGEAGQSFWEKG